MENQNDNPAELVPPDEQRCHRTNGTGWRCKNILSTSHNPSCFCDKHYNSSWYQNNYKSKKNHKINSSKLGRPDNHDFSDIEIGLKRRRVEHSNENSDDQFKKFSFKEEELKSLGEEETKKCGVKLEEIFGVCKTKCIELLLAEFEKKAMECIGLQRKLAESEYMKIAAEEEFEEFKRRLERESNLDRMVWGKKELRICEKVTYLEEELKKMEKDNQCLRNKVCDLEARVYRMENECVETHILETRGLQNDAPCDGVREGDNDLSKLEAKLSGGRLNSRACELQTKDEVLNKVEVDMVRMLVGWREHPNVLSGGQNVENGEYGSRLERASAYESSSENHLGLSVELNDNVGNTAAKNSASKESSDCSSDSESLGEVMERMAMKHRSKVNEIKWEFEADMLSSIEGDPELCMKAVCALYRQQNFEEKSANGLFRHLDAPRIRTLAEFLMEGDCKGDIKKSVKELEAFTPEVLDDCNRLASSYSKQLFSIYKDKRDPFFLPTSTASL